MLLAIRRSSFTAAQLRAVDDRRIARGSRGGGGRDADDRCRQCGSKKQGTKRRFRHGYSEALVVGDRPCCGGGGARRCWRRGKTRRFPQSEWLCATKRQDEPEACSAKEPADCCEPQRRTRRVDWPAASHSGGLIRSRAQGDHCRPNVRQVAHLRDIVEYSTMGKLHDSPARSEVPRNLPADLHSRQREFPASFRHCRLSDCQRPAAGFVAADGLAAFSSLGRARLWRTCRWCIRRVSTAGAPEGVCSGAAAPLVEGAFDGTIAAFAVAVPPPHCPREDFCVAPLA